MAILFADDFKGYGTNAAFLLDGLWGLANNTTLVEDPDPLADGPVMYLGGFGNIARRPFAKGALATAGVACRLWLPALPSFTCNAVRFLDGANVMKSAFAITPTGAMEATIGSPLDPDNVVGATAAPVMTANAWHHYEMKVVVDEFAGSIEIRVDGVTVLEVDGIDTGSALQLGLGTSNDYNGTDGYQMYVKDLVTWDGSGAHNTNFLGSVSVLGMTPNSDVDLNWTPSHGAEGWSLLDNSPPVDGVDYLTAVYPPPDPSVFGLTDLPINVTSVRAMISQVRARKVDGGDGNLQTSLISSGDDTNGSDRPITTAYTYYEDVFEVDPHTAASWTPASANAAQIQINRTV